MSQQNTQNKLATSFGLHLSQCVARYLNGCWVVEKFSVLCKVNAYCCLHKWEHTLCSVLSFTQKFSWLSHN